MVRSRPRLWPTKFLQRQDVSSHVGQVETGFKPVAPKRIKQARCFARVQTTIASVRSHCLTNYGSTRRSHISDVSSPPAPGRSKCVTLLEGSTLHHDPDHHSTCICPPSPLTRLTSAYVYTKHNPPVCRTAKQLSTETSTSFGDPTLIAHRPPSTVHRPPLAAHYSPIFAYSDAVA